MPFLLNYKMVKIIKKYKYWYRTLQHGEETFIS